MKLEDLRNKAKAGNFWKPAVGDEKVVQIGDEVQIGAGLSWECEDLTTGETFYIPEYGNLKKKGLKKGKYYYIACTAVSVLQSCVGKGKESRVFFVEELSKSDAEKLASELDGSESAPF